MNHVKSLSVIIIPCSQAVILGPYNPQFYSQGGSQQCGSVASGCSPSVFGRGAAWSEKELKGVFQAMMGGAVWVAPGSPQLSFHNVSGWYCHLEESSHALGRETEALWGEYF